MKKVLGVVVLSGILIFSGSQKAEAVILDFEGLTAATATPLPLTYGGFTWDSGWYLYNYPFYPTPTHSGSYGALNSTKADPLGVESATSFIFNGVWVAGWDAQIDTIVAPEKIKAQAFDAGDNLIGETDWLNVIVNENQYLAANFSGVSRVDFVGGGYFTLDDFTYDEEFDDETVTPEPATMALLGSGLFSMIGFRKKFN